MADELKTVDLQGGEARSNQDALVSPSHVVGTARWAPNP